MRIQLFRHGICLAPVFKRKIGYNISEKHFQKTMGRNVVFGCAGVCEEGRNESSPKNACVGDDIGNHFRTKALSKTSEGFS